MHTLELNHRDLSALMEDRPSMIPYQDKKHLAEECVNITFTLAEGVLPTTNETLRKMIRSVYSVQYLFSADMLVQNIVEKVAWLYGNTYPGLQRENLFIPLWEERVNFNTDIENAFMHLQTLSKVTYEDVYVVYRDYCMPFKLTKKILGKRAKHLGNKEFEKEINERTA